MRRSIGSCIGSCIGSLLTASARIGHQLTALAKHRLTAPLLRLFLHMPGPLHRLTAIGTLHQLTASAKGIGSISAAGRGTGIRVHCIGSAELTASPIASLPPAYPPSSRQRVRSSRWMRMWRAGLVCLGWAIFGRQT